MQPNTPAAPVSKGMLWTGYVLSALPTLGLIASAVMKFAKPEGLPKEFDRLGWPLHLATPLGVVELTCAILYAIPQNLRTRRDPGHRLPGWRDRHARAHRR